MSDIDDLTSSSSLSTLLIDDNWADNTVELEVGATYDNKHKAASAFLSDARHVGLPFKKKVDKSYFRYTCATDSCTARIRFLKCNEGWRVTVAAHDHQHETKDRLIKHAEVISDAMEEMLFFEKTRTAKSLHGELQAKFRSKVSYELVRATRRKILEDTKEDQVKQFTQLPDVIAKILHADQRARAVLQKNDGHFQRLVSGHLLHANTVEKL